MVADMNKAIIVAQPMPVKLHQRTSLVPATASMVSARSSTESQPPILFMTINPTSRSPKIITEQCTILVIAVPLSPPNTVKEMMTTAPISTPNPNGMPVTPLTMEPMI